MVAVLVRSAIIVTNNTNNIIQYKGPTEISNISNGIWGFGVYDFNNQCNIDEQTLLHIVCERLEKFNNGTSTNKGYAGSTAYRKYIEDFKTLKELDASEFQNTISQMYYDLRIDSILHLLSYTSNFIIHHSDVFGDRVAELNQGAEYLYNRWKRISFKLLKLGITNNKKGIDNIINNSRELLNMQEDYFNDLCRAISLLV